MTRLQFYMTVSRPRFWIYVFGPFALGWIAATPDIANLRFDWQVIALAVFFLLPANLLIYGVNDIFDYDTDIKNPKKQGYEFLVKPERYPMLWSGIVVLTLPFLAVLPFVSWLTILGVVGFLFFSLTYSAPPIRAKVRPFFDSIWNVLYVFPGVVGYAVAGGTGVSWTVFLAAGLWCMAMHAYSAVPDIRADTDAGLATIATRLGSGQTVVLCEVLYTAAAVITFPQLGYVSAVLAIPYIWMMIASLKVNEAKLFVLYRFFPKLNSVAGAAIFWALVLQRI